MWTIVNSTEVGMLNILLMVITISLLLSSALPVPGAATRSDETSGPNSYVSLGDSVAAGAGLPVSSGASQQDMLCERSPHSYPYKIARELNMPLAHLACTGARAGDLVTEQDIDGGEDIAAQLTQAFASGTPEVITITAGANDIRWKEFLQACYRLEDCSSNTATRLSNGWIYALKAKLYYALFNIDFRSAGTPPTVILTGYYAPLSMDCAASETRISKSEISWINQQTTKLNRTIEKAASRFDFAYYAPVSFKGHELCSSDPWIQEFGDAAPFHPTQRGQQVVADAVINAIRRAQP